MAFVHLNSRLRRRIHPQQAVGLNDKHFLRDRFHAAVLFHPAFGAKISIAFGGTVNFVGQAANTYTVHPLKGRRTLLGVG